MSMQQKNLLEFGNFDYCLDTRILRRNGKPISLPARASQVFDHLIRNRERFVSKGELKHCFWEEANVEHNTIEQQIAVIRRALGRQAKSFIKTKYKKGWRFVAEVREVIPKPESDQPAPVPEPTAQPNFKQTKTPFWRIFAGSVVTSALLSSLLVVFLARPNQAGVTQFVQLTNDGRPKHGPILTDGKRLFFTERQESVSRILSIPVAGGEPVPLPGTSGAVLKDISPDRQNLLLLRGEDDGKHSVWGYSPENASSELIARGVDTAAWRDNNSISLVRHNSIFVRDLRSQRESKLLDLPGSPEELKWSPDGKILRFSVSGAHEQRALWQFSELSRKLQYLPCGQKYPHPGSWSPDQHYFFYDAGDAPQADIWVESLHGLNALTRPAVRLTNGPGWWISPDVSSDSSHLFALHEEHRTTLTRFNPQKNEWEDMWDASAVLELDYSPDRQWVAFVHQPDHIIWKSRPDGSERARLTSAGFNARQPHWSRDGERIAFMGQNSMGAYRIFIVGKNGGAVEELQPRGLDQGVPTWSPDDTHILFGELRDRRRLADMCLQTIEIATGKIDALSGSNGLWSSRWSPDGKSILAVTTDSQRIRVSPIGASHWRDVVSMAFVDNVTWSYDSRYIYFNGLLRPYQPFGLYRVNVNDGMLESLADLRGFPIPGENWWGVTPDGSLLATKEYLNQEIFALK